MRVLKSVIDSSCLAAILATTLFPLSALASASVSGQGSTTSDQSPFEPSSKAAAAPDSSSNHDPGQEVMTSNDLDEKLRMPANFDFDEVPFGEVMGELQNNYRINMVLDQSAKDDSLTKDEPVSCRLRQVRLATFLRFLLQTKNATYVVDEGILRIISLDVASDAEFHRRKIFDCRPLLDRIRVIEKDRIGTPVSAQRLPEDQWGGGRGRGGGVFSYPSTLQTGGGQLGGMGRLKEADDELETETLTTGLVSQMVAQQPDHSGAVKTDAPSANPFEKAAGQGGQLLLIKRVTAEGMLINLIRKSVQPDSWESTNGDGTLMVIGGCLVATQSEQALDEIEELIADLENRLSQQ